MIIPDEMLMAYVDGELDEVRRARVERAAAEDAEVARRLETQRRLRERLAAHYAPVAEEEVPERFRALLDPPAIDLESVRRQRRAVPSWRTAVAIAASLVVGLFAGRMLAPPAAGPVAVADGALVARGPLAEALDTQLASAQPADSPVRIGLTFASADGPICRTFESAALAGLACRGGEQWRLVVTGPGASQSTGGYRQAASGSLVVLEAAQEMMAGEPLDAEAERRARESGWAPRRD